MITNEQIDDMQRQLAEWQARNFANVDDRDLALGIVEELGEYFEAETEEDRRDAIGDVLIYCGQLLARNWIKLSANISNHGDRDGVSARRVIVAAGMICHAALKRHQKIRGFDDHEKYRDELSALALVLTRILAREETLRAIYLEVGAKVLQRDWKANPVTAEANGGES